MKALVSNPRYREGGKKRKGKKASYVSHAGPKLLGSRDPLAEVFGTAGNVSAAHSTWFLTAFLCIKRDFECFSGENLTESKFLLGCTFFSYNQVRVINVYPEWLE